MLPVPLRIATRSKIAPMSPKNGSSRWPANAFELPPSNETIDFVDEPRGTSGSSAARCCSAGVVPRATTLRLSPLAMRVTVNGCAVSPRKSGPVFRVNWNR